MMRELPFIPKKLSELAKLVDRFVLVDPTNGSDTLGTVGGRPFATFAAAVTAALTASTPPSPVPVHVAAGTYGVSGTVTSSIHEMSFRGLGRVYLSWSGSASAMMLFDGDQGTDQLDNYQLENFHFNGEGGATYGLDVSGCHQGNFQNIRVVGVDLALARFRWMVCGTLMNWTSHPLIEGYSTPPVDGYVFDKFSSGFPSVCAANALISVSAYDYTGIGAKFVDNSGCFGNVFLGGGFSGAAGSTTTKGIYFGTTTSDNGAIGTGLETNEIGAHVAGDRCFLMASNGIGSKLLIDGRGFYNLGGTHGAVTQNGAHGFYVNRSGGTITCGASGNYVEMNPPEWHPQPAIKSANASGKLIMFASGGGVIYGEAAGDSLILGSAGKSVWIGIDGAASATALKINDTGVFQFPLATGSKIRGNNGSGTYRDVIYLTGNNLVVGNTTAGDAYYLANGTHEFQTSGGAPTRVKINSSGLIVTAGLAVNGVATPPAKPTITGNVTTGTLANLQSVVDQILTALANIGFITDSTT